MFICFLLSWLVQQIRVLLNYRYFTWFNVGNTTDIFKDLDVAGDILAELNNTVLKNGCIYQSIIQLWETSLMKDVRNLTKKEILEDVTKAIKQK